MVWPAFKKLGRKPNDYTQGKNKSHSCNNINFWNINFCFVRPNSPTDIFVDSSVLPISIYVAVKGAELIV
jgi:hypothetical protein